MKQLNPLSATQRIGESYARYLQTLYPISDEELSRQFSQMVSHPERLVRGPYLEATPPYKHGLSIGELIEKNVLSPLFSDIASESLPVERPLYAHQEEAVRKLTSGRNLIVATGTGSGKTETFLIPILHHLLEQKRRGELSHGVRALLLYPMNALANDQMKRLRSILRNCGYITFGRYTGETPRERKEAEKLFRENFKTEPMKNERLSRREMQDAPPHILLTNYAMLEYLLLRPRDSALFDGQYARDWRFIVLDEVHTYDGAKGIETAMLLRRLKDRIIRSERGRIRCIGTSATLGGGRKDFPDVVKFGEHLFDEPFEWIDDNPERQDVVEAQRLTKDDYPKVWGEPDPEFYLAAQSLFESSCPDIDEMSSVAISHGVPETVISQARQKSDSTLNGFLYSILEGDGNLERLRGLLSDAGENKPRLLSDAAAALFRDEEQAERRLIAMVDLAAQARPDGEYLPLLPARYHLFVKAMEGGFVAFGPEKRLFLSRRKEIERDGETYSVFELATCKRCGAIHLVGEVKSEEGRLVQSQKLTEENRERAKFFLLKENPLDALDEDEEIAESETAGDEAEEIYRLCVRCGAIDRRGAKAASCECSDDWMMTATMVSNEQGFVTRCRSCGARSPNLVSRFLTGQDAPASVLATALYQEIPEREVEQAESSDDDEYRNQTVKARRLLIFSDSRQDAAYFAPYLGEITYLPILWRRLMILTLEKHERECIENEWRVSDLVEPLRREAVSNGVIDDGLSRQAQLSESWKWIMRELIAQDRRNSLEGLGLARFSLAKPQAWIASPKLRSLLAQLPFDFSDDELWELYQILIDSFRLQSALLFPDSVSPEDDFFRPRNRLYYFREKGGAAKKHIFGWIPTAKGMLNRRLDFVQKLIKRCAPDAARDEMAREILKFVWKAFIDENSPFHKALSKPYFVDSSRPGEGPVLQLRYDFWQIRPTLNSSNDVWHQCDTCGNLFSHNLRGVCPFYKCEGTLQPCDPAQVRGDNHYRHLYLHLDPMRMICKEHTAQLTSEAASELQTRFVRGEVNVISCSTTFELGVDVGSLESVFMRNAPPSPANYIQRAGRAGRRTDSTAFALTFCRRRPFDLSCFNDPEKMISGTIRPPCFEVRNKKIIRRHLHSVALAMFWKENESLFGKVENFFFSVAGRNMTSGEQFFDAHPLREFLERRPQQLLDALKRILKDQHEEFEIETWGWLKDFFFSQEAALRKAADEVYSDVAGLEAHIEELIATRQLSSFNRIQKTINTIKGKPIIDFLATRGALPKYGFPVDVIELQLLHHGAEAQNLDLQRDLRIALSEYAPESQIVADGRLWTSYAIKRVAKREWRKYRYAICAGCNCYQRVLADSGEGLTVCKNCDRSFGGRKEKGAFIIPEFGFVSGNKEPGRPGETRPEKTYTTPQIFYTPDKSARKEKDFFMQLGDVRLEIEAISDGLFAVLNRSGFKVCFRCGYAARMVTRRRTSHRTPQGKECGGTLEHNIDLGHEFQTDLLRLDFIGQTGGQDFWLSLLYALLEGASESLPVIRSDLDGCLYPYRKSSSSVILFDNVPGGAGHVRRLASEQAIKDMMSAAYEKVARCDCGEETSCDGCLQNYRNQFHHDELKRGLARDFLRRLI